MDAKNVKLSSKEYFVRGSTALLDAVGKTILDVGYRMSIMNESDRPNKVIFVITTDGLENASREFTYVKVNELIKHQQEKYNWEFIFLGANIDAVKEADNLGISVGNAYNFKANHAGIADMFCCVCESVSEKRNPKRKK